MDPYFSFHEITAVSDSVESLGGDYGEAVHF